MICVFFGSKACTFPISLMRQGLPCQVQIRSAQEPKDVKTFEQKAWWQFFIEVSTWLIFELVKLHLCFVPYFCLARSYSKQKKQDLFFVSHFLKTYPTLFGGQRLIRSASSPVSAEGQGS